jgi:hypothetical protein
MKKLSLKILLSFGILLGANATASAQLDSTSTCSGIHYSDEMDKAAQECWENSTERESMLSECLTTWSELETELGTYQIRNEALREINVDLSNENDNLKKKVKRNRNAAFAGVFVGVGAVVLSIFIK